MPPRIKITKEMIVEAGVQLVRESGIENVNVRTIAERLKCSTQPVLYSFKTIEEVKRAIYAKIDMFHTEYLMNVQDDNILLGIGLNYIRFAVNEPNCFKFLLQSGYVKEKNLLEIINSEELTPVISAMENGLGMSTEKTKEVFLTISLFAHGYASIIANNSMDFDEELVARHLERAFQGAVMAAREDSV